MRWFLLRALAVIGFFSVVGSLVLLVGVVLAVERWGRPDTLPDRIALTLRLDADSVGGGGNMLRHLLSPDRLGLVDLVQVLEAARHDERVGSLFVDLSEARLSAAAAQELADSLSALRTAGKRVIAFADTIGETGGGLQVYRLGIAADRLWVQPAGEVNLTAPEIEQPFAAGLLGKFGIEPVFVRREAWKGFPETFTRRDFSPDVRENLGQLVADIERQTVTAVAIARQRTPEVIRAAMRTSPHGAGTAQENRLIDQTGYADQARTEALVHAGAGAKAVSVGRYRAALPPPPKEATRIALIEAHGAVMRGHAGSPLSGDETVLAGPVVRAFAAAARDPRVLAIILRIDSPGGSYVASDSISRAIDSARDSGKKVIVSMGSVAASGGYFIAMGADKIVAAPGTITGSIGVVSGRFVLTGFWDMIGLAWDRVGNADGSNLFALGRPLTDWDRQRLEAGVTRAYADFAGRVARFRKLDGAQAAAATGGRVFSGERARDLGLVDALGGFTTALALARQELGLRESAPIDLVTFDGAEGDSLARLRRVLDGHDAVFGALARVVARLNAVMAPGVRLENPAQVFGAAPM